VSLVTAGWALWAALLVVSLCGLWHELVVRPRRERMRELLRIVSTPSEFWAVDWIDC